MRKPVSILLLLLGPLFAIAANPKFFIATSANNKAAAAHIAFFESRFSNALKKEFPCAETLSQSDVASLLELERQKQLLGTGDYEALSNLGEAMGSDYLVSLKVRVLENMAIIDAFCVYTRRTKVIARATASAISGDASLDAVEKVSSQLVEGLKQYEICPFTGPINVEVKTEFTDKKTESYAVYCNGTDGLYKLDVSTDKTSHAYWKLSKTGKNQTSGPVSYNLREYTETEEQNDCYTCPSGRQGSRLYTEKITKTAKVEGLSNESIADNQQIEDAWAKITFLDNGTYTLKVKAASRKGDLKHKTEKHAEGTCDVINKPPVAITKKADVPLNEILGPFPGSGNDKILSQNGSYQTENPVTKEKTTVTYSFNLKRD